MGWTGAYVRVWHRQNASNLEELAVVLSAIDRVLHANGSGHLLFDSRDVEYTPGEVQTGIWDWLGAHRTLVRVATLVESEGLAISVNMNGLGKRIPIRAFHDEVGAAAWLESGRRRAVLTPGGQFSTTGSRLAGGRAAAR